VYTIFVGKIERKTPLGRSGRRWKDSIKINIEEVGLNFAKWINLTVYMD
jgi:hypothetical protein